MHIEINKTTNNMKTQINTLVNGNATRVGTSTSERLNTMARVFAENGDDLKISIRLTSGEEMPVMLCKRYSTSGKTAWYSSRIKLEQFEKLHTTEKANDRESASYSITIDSEGHCEVYGHWSYKTPSGRTRSTTYTREIEASRITIL